MKDALQYLNRQRLNANIKFYGGIALLVCTIVMFTPLIQVFLSGTDLEQYHEPWWMHVMNFTGVLCFIGAVILLKIGMSERSRLKYFTEDARCMSLDIEVTDKFKFLKRASEGIEIHYYLVSKEGTWLLPDDKKEMFGRIQPGALIHTSVIDSPQVKQIIDLEVYQAGEALREAGVIVMDKVASEVEITGYREGGYDLSKRKSDKDTPTVHFYLLVGQRVVEVNRETFNRNRLYSLPEGKR